ncbi:hypothetical protein [Tabrizicola piscis]|uniref:hypothetical protein n=1 Tax=Tabrizicola piscis TaxID=2494374 RepID=UPI0013DDED5E|nr:hypothetical protein [Tabrizicola piscis]
MLTSLLRAWRAHRHRAEVDALARRLGPHIARDIGIGGADMSRALPTLCPV